MTGYADGTAGVTARVVDFLRLRGRLEASPFHFINLGVLAYIGMGQVSQGRGEVCNFCAAFPVRLPRNKSSGFLFPRKLGIRAIAFSVGLQASRQNRGAFESAVTNRSCYFAQAVHGKILETRVLYQVTVSFFSSGQIFRFEYI